MLRSDGKKANRRVKIYLTSWQKRMVKDFTSKKVLAKIGRVGPAAIEIEFKPGGCLASYKIPPDGFLRDDWVIYLTDEQITMVSHELGLREHIDAVNISMKDIEGGVIQFM